MKLSLMKVQGEYSPGINSPKINCDEEFYEDSI